MTNPIASKSIEDESGAATGREVETLGHGSYSMFAIAAGEGDTNNVEIVLEGSPDREHWAVLDDPDGDNVKLDNNDFENDPDSGEEVAYTGGRLRGHYIRYIRARVETAPDDADLTVWVMATGNTDGRGVRPTERKGPAADL